MSCSPAGSTARCCSRGHRRTIRRRPADSRPRRAGVGDEERRAIDRLLAAVGFRRRVGRCARSPVDMRDVYPPTHWAIRGQPPAYDTPDEDVYLEGRNVVLIARPPSSGADRRHRPAAARAARRTIRFRTPRRRSSRRWRSALSLGLGPPLAIDTPLAALHKDDVIRLRRGARRAARADVVVHEADAATTAAHCGRCSKCRERRDGFIDAGIEDPTRYAVGRSGCSGTVDRWTGGWGLLAGLVIEDWRSIGRLAIGLVIYC